MPSKNIFDLIETKEGYLVYFNCTKYEYRTGIFVKKGKFETYKHKKWETITTHFYPNDHYDMILIHSYMPNMEITSSNKIYVENEEDVDTAISLLKDHLSKKIEILNKEYEKRIKNLKTAIESEVRYGDL